MEIYKRNGQIQQFNIDKIRQAIFKAFKSLNTTINQEDLEAILNEIVYQLNNNESLRTVENIQDLVEEMLMEKGYFKEAKAYILYRQKQSEKRLVISKFKPYIQDEKVIDVLYQIEKEFSSEGYLLTSLFEKFVSFYKTSMSQSEIFDALIRSCVELISMQAPKWEYIAARFLTLKINEEIDTRFKQYGIFTFKDKVHYLVEQGLYGKYIIEHYSDEELEVLGDYLNEERSKLFTYSGLELVVKRYLIRSHSHLLLEKVQEMFMGIAMHLGMNEVNKIEFVKDLYDVLSSLKVTMATPTMSNARKPFHQLSSCFIDTVPDSLEGIYKSIDSFAQVSKFGGGMGMYFGKIRASGSPIRGFEGAAGGVIRWIKLVNDTAIAVDQLGVRQGAVAVYLDAWHKDLPEFLSLRTNNGDDRMKAHDVFLGVCYPDLFWQKVKENINGTWYLMCPYEIQKAKGYALEDFYGKEWEKRYEECVHDPRISKREIVLKDLVRLILKSAVETGNPFAFYRDSVNKMNPNQHCGMIYCSNLCTEIAQNMSPATYIEQSIVEVDGQKVVVEKTQAGDFVVCNLASLVLGNIDVNNAKELESIIKTIVRALDNVIDLNFYPTPFAKITNAKYRAIGLGMSGYHHMLCKQGITFESDEHLKFVDELFENINYYALKASHELAIEKGSYQCFEGSDYQTGAYFEKRDYNSPRFKELQAMISEKGLRNGYLLAIAPTSSTSIIAGTTASVDPIMNKFFYEEKKGSMIARVAPDLDMSTFWLYKHAHHMNQEWLIKAAGIRQRHLDQSQSLNLYITNEYTLSQVLKLYILACELGVKTIYYVRSQSLEIEECVSCSA